MSVQHHGTVVGVFSEQGRAREAVADLKAAGFLEDQIGVAGVHRSPQTETRAYTGKDESYVGEGAVAGLAAGAGIGALWGLGVMTLALPAIGPAIAGGALLAIASSAAAGAAAAGLAGALIGMGISKEEAEYYEDELREGRTIVSVNAGTRWVEARTILENHGGYDMSRRLTAHDASEETPPVRTVGFGDISDEQRLQRAEYHRTFDVPLTEEELRQQKQRVEDERF